LKQASNISLISVINSGTNLNQQEAHQATKDLEFEPINYIYKKWAATKISYLNSLVEKTDRTLIHNK
jgi:hypothetical protein